MLLTMVKTYVLLDIHYMNLTKSLDLIFQNNSDMLEYVSSEFPFDSNRKIY